MLREVPLFRNLSEGALRAIEKVSIYLNYCKGETLFTKDQKATGFYILVKGKVKLYTLDPSSGREQIIKVVEPITLFGEAASLSGKEFPVFAEAMTDSRILYIDRSQLLKLSESYPEICMSIASILAERLYHLVGLVELLNIPSATSRVARHILNHCRGGIFEDFRTTFVAKELGLTTEAVSRAIAYLKREGIVQKEGRTVKILDFQKLKLLAGID